MELQKINLNSTKPATTTNPISQPAKLENMPSENKSFLSVGKIIGLILALGLGLGAGYVVKAMAPAGVIPGTSSSGTVTKATTEGGVKEGDVIGSTDSNFKDNVTGVLQKGGIDGEGSHKLLRPGGASQTVYLTSSVIDLDNLVGDQVTVWGETFKGTKAGWLMDVGRARVEKLNAEVPQ